MKANEAPEQYISKSALVTEIERLREKLQDKVETSDFIAGEVFIMNYFLSFIVTLEVKEVDVDIDIRTYLTNHFNIYEDGVLQSKESGLPLSTYDIIKVAKHFFELGMRSK